MIKLIYKYGVLAMLLACINTNISAQKNTAKKAEVSTEGTLQWLTWDEVNKRMAVEPRKVYVDFYTDWCGWCKTMDKTTFSNPALAAYMNKNFYCIKFNPEKDDNIQFLSKIYGIENGMNELATKLIGEKKTYPTGLVFMEHFMNPQKVPGYQSLEDFEVIITYFSSNGHTRLPFEKYKAEYVLQWK
jgi:thioredoxin-related protein